MSDRDAELFLRFRRTGEPAALAQVFDRVAPDLLRVARHACGNLADAEDVVQATFVAAIEHAARWDERRGLFPWLCGILVRQAGNVRRARRAPDPQRLATARGSEAADPASAAQDAELDASVRAAIEQLDELYRPVVRLHLRHGLGGAEIAEALGRPHARVRQQLVRGLQRLRALLPSGLAVGVTAASATAASATAASATAASATAASATAASGVGRGLAAVREAVLATARERVLVTGAAGAAAGGAMVLTFGGGVMWKQVLAGAALALLALAWWTMAPPEPEWSGARGDAAAAPANAGLVDRDADPRGAANAAQRAEIAADTEPGALRLLATNGVDDFDLDDHPGAETASRAVVDLPVELWRGESPLRPRDGVRLVRTGSDGEALVQGLEPGSWMVDPIGPRGPDPVLVAAGAETRFRLPIVYQSFVQGRVVDAAGVPVPGATILVLREQRELDWFGGLWRREATHSPELDRRAAASTDAHGRFAIFSLQDEWFVAAMAEHYAPSRPQPCWSASMPETTLVLGGEVATVRVHVRGDDGGRIHGARVCLRNGNAPATWRVDGALQGSPLALLAHGDESGTAAFADVAPGQWQVHAIADSTATGYAQVDVIAGGRHEVEVTVRRGATVRGRVLGASGRPMAGVRIRATQGDRRGHMGAMETDQHGAFALRPLPARPIELLVEAGQRVLAARTLDLGAGGEFPCDFEIEDGGVLRGRVVDHAGAPLRLWHLEAIDDGELAGHFDLPITRDDGSFALTRWRRAPCRIRVSAPDGSRQDPEATVDVDAAATEVEIRVGADRVGSVRGRLRTPAGEPMQVRDHLFLVVPGQDNQRETVQTAADGSFAFERVPPGSFELQCTFDGQRHRVPFTLARGQHLDLGPVAAEPLARFRVEFAHADGTPWRGALPDVRLFAQPGGGDVPVAGWRVRGRAFEGSVPAGTVKFAVDAPDLIALPQLAQLRAGELATVHLVLAVGRSREIVFGGDGSIPYDQASIHAEVMDASGGLVAQRSFRRSRSGDGAWTLYETLPIGAYSVTARTDSGLRFAGAFEVREDPGQSRRVLVPRLP